MGSFPEEIISALRRAKIVRQLSEPEREQVACAVVCRQYGPDCEVAYSHGLLLVVRGYVDVLGSSPEGRVLREARYGTGTLLCPRAGSEWGPSFSIRAGGKGTLVGTIPSESLAKAVQGNSQALLEMLTWQNDDVSRAERLAALKALYVLRGQIALRLAEEALADPDCLVRTTHAQLALDLGCSRSHLTEILNEFRALGLIEYRRHDAHRRVIAVTNLEGLPREAGE